VIDHGATNSATACGLGGVHRLQLSMARVKLSERANANEFTVEAEAEEGDARAEETVDVESVDVLGWAVLVAKRQVALQQLAYVLGPWVVLRDLPAHRGSSSKTFERASGCIVRRDV